MNKYEKITKKQPGTNQPRRETNQNEDNPFVRGQYCKGHPQVKEHLCHLYFNVEQP